MPTNQNKAYFGIIPANIRYDANVSANAKLLFAEITALSNEKGYCWATNEYFAELYKTTPRTIQRWIKELSDNSYIYVTANPRYISLNDIRDDKNVVGGRQKCRGGDDKNVTHNNIKNIKNNNSIYNTHPTLDDIKAYCKERGNNVNAQQFFDYYESAGWKDGRGNPVLNWKQKMIAVWESKPSTNKKTFTANEMQTENVNIEELKNKLFKENK